MKSTTATVPSRSSTVPGYAGSAGVSGSLAGMTGFTELASVDGGIGPTAEASIGLKDDGLYRGDGAFEVIRLYDGRPYALDDHIARLERSAAACASSSTGWRCAPRSTRCSSEAGPIEGQLRLIVTRGGRRIAATENIPVHAETTSVASVTYQPTIVLNGVKSLSYGANMLATRLAKEGGFDEALLVRPDGIVLEPPTSSIFWVADGALRTTAIREGVLASITRDRLLKAIPGIEEGAWTLDQVKGASEAFLASTTREIQAVASIDGVALPGGARPAHPRGAAGLRRRPRRRARAAAETEPNFTATERQGMDFNLSDEQKLIAETAREFADREILPQRARERPRRTLRPRAGPQARRGRLPRPDPRRKIRRPEPRLHRLRADRRSDRPRRLLRPHRRLRADLAGRLGDRKMGDGGAEGTLAAGPLQRRGPRLLRPDRARHRLRRRQPAHPGDEDRLRLVDQRPEDVDLTRQRRRVRPDLRPDRPGEEAQGPRRLPRPDRLGGLHQRRRSTASSACAPPTPRSSRSTRSRSATTPCSARSATASRWR